MPSHSRYRPLPLRCLRSVPFSSREKGTWMSFVPCRPWCYLGILGCRQRTLKTPTQRKSPLQSSIKDSLGFICKRAIWSTHSELRTLNLPAHSLPKGSHLPFTIIEASVRQISVDLTVLLATLLEAQSTPNKLASKTYYVLVLSRCTFRETDWPDDIGRGQMQKQKCPPLIAVYAIFKGIDTNFTNFGECSAHVAQGPEGDASPHMIRS